MGAPLSCTIRDKSFSGAMLEFALDRYADEVTDVSVGDEVMLTMNTAAERTSVPCVIVRISGRRAGVRFTGQFQTQVNKPRKPSAIGESRRREGRRRQTRQGEARAGCRRQVARRQVAGQLTRRPDRVHSAARRSG